MEKMKIAIETQSNPITFGKTAEVLFNPTQLTFRGSGVSVKEGQVTSDNTPTTLTVDFFLDTTLKPREQQDVRTYTKPIYTLTRTQGNLKRPPLVRLSWGIGDVLLLQGFLQSVTKTLTHFREDGTPVRATLNCVFQEWQPPELKEKIQNPIDDPVRIVRRGETLSSIAAEEYNDASLWRLIADENRLTNPRKLVAGQQLTVPPLRVR